MESVLRYIVEKATVKITTMLFIIRLYFLLLLSFAIAGVNLT